MHFSGAWPSGSGCAQATTQALGNPGPARPASLGLSQHPSASSQIPPLSPSLQRQELGSLLTKKPHLPSELSLSCLQRLSHFISGETRPGGHQGGTWAALPLLSFQENPSCWPGDCPFSPCTQASDPFCPHHPCPTEWRAAE